MITACTGRVIPLIQAFYLCDHFTTSNSHWLHCGNAHTSTYGAQVAEEEAEDLSAPVEEEEELAEDSMDDDQRGLPGLGKRRSTDTTSSVQTASKRPRPGSLAEV